MFLKLFFHRLFFISLVLLPTISLDLIAPPANAVEATAARRFVETTANEVITLATTRMGNSVKRDHVRNLITDKGALDDVARVAIGRVWKTMTGVQKKRYVDAFADMLATQMVTAFAHYSGQKLQINGTEDRGKSGVFVKTWIARGAGKQPVQVDWRIIDRNGPLQLFDVYVDGVSLLMTQRQTFSARLEKVAGNVDQFTAILEAENKALQR